MNYKKLIKDGYVLRYDMGSVTVTKKDKGANKAMPLLPMKYVEAQIEKGDKPIVECICGVLKGKGRTLKQGEVITLGIEQSTEAKQKGKGNKLNKATVIKVLKKYTGLYWDVDNTLHGYFYALIELIWTPDGVFTKKQLKKIKQKDMPSVEAILKRIGEGRNTHNELRAAGSTEPNTSSHKVTKVIKKYIGVLWKVDKKGHHRNHYYYLLDK